MITHGTSPAFGNRFIIEQFRSDSLMLGNIKVAQLVSIIFITTGIILIINSIKKKKMYNKKSKEEVWERK